MTLELLHDRGRGPEITGTRITVYNLLPYLLDPAITEDYICRLYELSPQQVAAVRAYALENADAVLSVHRQIEARLALGNSAEIVEIADKTHDSLIGFREWLAMRVNSNCHQNVSEDLEANQSPSFGEWLNENSRRPDQGSRDAGTAG